MPPTQAERVRLLQTDSTAYIRSMGSTEIDKLLLALSATRGLSDADVSALTDDLYNVPIEYVGDV